MFRIFRKGTLLRNLRKGAAGGDLRLEADTTLTPADFEGAGIRIRYNPQELSLDLQIASERRASRTVQVPLPSLVVAVAAEVRTAVASPLSTVMRSVLSQHDASVWTSRR